VSELSKSSKLFGKACVAGPQFVWQRKSRGSPLAPTSTATSSEEVDSHDSAVVLADGKVLWKGGDLETWRRCWVAIGVRRKSRRNLVETLSNNDLCDLWWRGVVVKVRCRGNEEMLASMETLRCWHLERR